MNGRGWLLPALLGLAVFVAGLLVMLPAHVAYRVFVPEIPGFAAGEIGGTLWSGHAGRVTIGGRPAGALEWRLRPLTLIGGGAGIEWRWLPPGGDLSGRLRPGGTRQDLLDLNGGVPLAGLLEAAAVSLPLAIDGHLELAMPRLAIRSGLPVEARGNARLRAASVDFGDLVPVGDFLLTADTGDDGTLTGLLADEGGPLELAATIRLAPDRGWTLHARLRARPTADANLLGALQLLGRSDAQGYYVLNFSGRL